MAVDKPADACRHGITSKGKKKQKATITTATTKIIAKKKTGYKQTITRRSNNNLCPNCCWRSISWMLVVRHKTTEVRCFNSKNAISILATTTKVELKRQRQKL